MQSLYLLWYTGLKLFRQFFSYLVTWWHRKILAKFRPNRELMAAPPIWLVNNESFFDTAWNRLTRLKYFFNTNFNSFVEWNIYEKGIQMKGSHKHFRILLNIFGEIKRVLNCIIVASKWFEQRNKKNCPFECTSIYGWQSKS